MRSIAFFILLSACALAQAGEHGGGGGGGAAADAVKLDNFVVNLQDRQAYLSFTPYLKLNDAKEQDRVKAYMPALRHEIIKIVIGQPSAGASSPQFMESVAKSITTALNKVMQDDIVKAVYFNDWIVQ
jgi:flagellar FliL protein